MAERKWLEIRDAITDEFQCAILDKPDWSVADAITSERTRQRQDLVQRLGWAEEALRHAEDRLARFDHDPPKWVVIEELTDGTRHNRGGAESRKEQPRDVTINARGALNAQTIGGNGVV